MQKEHSSDAVCRNEISKIAHKERSFVTVFYHLTICVDTIDLQDLVNLSPRFYAKIDLLNSENSANREFSVSLLSYCCIKSRGDIPVNFLKARLKVALELKPHS